MVGAFLVQSAINRQAPDILSSIRGGLITSGIIILGAEERITTALALRRAEETEREKLLAKIDIER